MLPGASTRLPCLAALALLGILCAPARADDAWQKTWREHAALGRVQQMTQMLTDEKLASIEADARELFRTVSAVEEFGAPLSRTEPKAYGGLLAKLIASATKHTALDPTNVHYRTAAAFATAATCRHIQLNGYKKAQPPWLEAAEQVAKLSAKSNIRSEFAVRAPFWLGEAALGKAEDHEALLARAKEMIDEIAKRNPPEELLQEAMADWYTARARVGRAKKKKPYGKAAVLEGMEYLKPHLGAKKLPKPLATLHTNLVAENIAGRFGLKLEMRTKERKFSQDGLVLVIPDSGEWEFPGSDSTSNAAAAQRMAGGAGRRTYTLQSWPEDATLYLDKAQSQTASVGKPKEFAKAFLPTIHEFTQIEDVTHRDKPRKVRLHKDFTDAWRIIVEGYTSEKKWLRFVSYYFRSKKTTRVYTLRITEYQRETEEDPVAEFVLVNLHLKE